MPVKINGSTSGSVTLAAPATGSDVTVTLPGTTGTVALDSTAGGLVLVSTQSFTASSAATLSNVFTSTYTNYRVLLRATNFSAATNVLVRLAASGTANSTTNYRWYLSEKYLASGTDAEYRTSTSNTAWTISFGTNLGSTNTDASIEVGSPQAAAQTTLTHQGTYSNTTQNSYMYLGGGAFIATTQFDGISFIPASGTFDCTVSVYGYRK